MDYEPLVTILASMEAADVGAAVPSVTKRAADQKLGETQLHALDK